MVRPSLKSTALVGVCTWTTFAGASRELAAASGFA